MTRTTDPRPPATLQAEADECWLDAEALCRLAGVDPLWLHTRIDEGLLAVVAYGPGDAWRFDAVALHRVRRLVCLERDFDAAPELAALVADLEQEVRALRSSLARSGGGR